MRAQMSDSVDVSEDPNLDPATREKLRRKKMEEDAELDIAMDAFGMGGVATEAEKPRPSAPVSVVGGIEGFAAASDADFEKLADLMVQKLSAYEGTKGHMVCVKALLRGVTNNMDPESIKELEKVLSVVSNDKLKAEREKDKKKVKGKAKGKLNIAASKASDVDGGYDDLF